MVRMPAAAQAASFSALWLGAALGLGAYTFVYARGYSYFSNDPAACANCHVMRDYFDSWQRSSHHASAVCNDCHTPHPLVGKYLTKAETAGTTPCASRSRISPTPSASGPRTPPNCAQLPGAATATWPPDASRGLRALPRRRGPRPQEMNL